MKNTSYPTTLKAYLKSRFKTLLLFCAFLLIIIVVYSLYQLPPEPLIYSCQLVCALGACLAIISYLRFHRKHISLVMAQKSVTTDLSNLPAAVDLIEADYQCLLEILNNDHTALISRYDSRQSEMNDYYTLWVHQIKTPISAMRLLLQESEDEKTAGLHGQELFKIEQYVEMVLQYLRLESIASDMLLKEYSLYDLARQAVKKYAMMFIRKKIALELTPFNTMILTDEKWMVFVLEQIISNALKYTPQGTVKIRMDTNSEKMLIIEDTGIGISPEDISRVFEKGFTGYNGRMDKKSTGIGLYLCRAITEKLHHQISLTSTVGVGTTVKINFKTAKFNIAD